MGGSEEATAFGAAQLWLFCPFRGINHFTEDVSLDNSAFQINNLILLTGFLIIEAIKLNNILKVVT